MKKHHQLGFLGLIAVVVVLTLAVADLPKRTAFADLKVGQQVGLKDLGAIYEISVLDDNTPQSHKIIEIGSDFIILKDVAGVTQTTIPVTALKSIVRMKTK